MSVKMKLNLIHFIPWRLFVLILIFASASSWLYLLVINAPQLRQQDRILSSDGQVNDGDELDAQGLEFPHNLEELQKLSRLLLKYKQLNPSYVILLFISAYLFKQTFAIPGSVFLNLLSGALFGLTIGLPLCCLLTAIGSTFCYLLSKHCGKAYVEKYFSSRLIFLRDKTHQNGSSLIYVLLFLRLFPMTPNWFLNIASPIIHIPLSLFFVSVFIGLMPYNYMCVQTGVILSELDSLDDLLTAETIIKLAIIALIVLLPYFISKRNQKKDKNKNDIPSSKLKV